MVSITIIILSLMSFPCRASLAENDLLEKIQEVSKSFEKKDEQERRILSQVYKLQTQQRKLERDIKRLDGERANLQRSIKSGVNRLSALNTEIENLKNLISVKLRLTARIVDDSLKEILLTSKNPNETERMLKGLSHLLKKDMAIVNNLKVKNKDFLEEQAKTKARVKLLTDNKQNLEKKKESLEKLRSQKDEIVNHLKKDKKTYLSLLKSLRKKGAEAIINKELQTTILKKNFFEYKKQLEPPVRGGIHQGYGSFNVDRSLKLFSKGIYFKTNEISDVSAVAAGKVIYLGDVMNYRNTLVIDHDNHYYSVYSFIKNPKVRVGQHVDKNQIIGQSGFNPYMKHHGIYFEIRHFSDPLNPEDWFISDYKIISKTKSGQRESL